MKAKDIENILNTSGRLVLKDGILGEMYYIENDDGCSFPILKKQFYKYKDTCGNKDESEQRWLREQTSTWYYWRYVMKQSDYVIKYDKLNEIYTCNINSKCVSSETLVDMVKHIGNIHNYDCWFIRDVDEYVEDLEKFANISINYDF